MLTPEQVAEIRQDNERIWSEEADTQRPGSIRLLLSDRADALLQLAQAEQALAEAKSRLLHTQAGLTVWMERSKSNARELDEAYDAMCEIAQMLDCAEDWAAIKAALKETLGKVGELQAAVADAPHDMWCAVTFPAAPADLMSCNCWKSETK
tara:strand:- start:2083 stop:2538 length:456 start_codon:yes stop_codon:yes gene_type:complete